MIYRFFGKMSRFKLEIQCGYYKMELFHIMAKLFGNIPVKHTLNPEQIVQNFLVGSQISWLKYHEVFILEVVLSLILLVIPHSSTQPSQIRAQNYWQVWKTKQKDGIGSRGSVRTIWKGLVCAFRKMDNTYELYKTVLRNLIILIALLNI